VLPGAKLDGRSLYELIEQEAVTLALGVPSVWLALLEYVEKNDLPFSSFKRVIVGGAANSRRIVSAFARLGVETTHSWGMTELSPTGVVGALTPEIADLPADEQMPWRLRQGRPPITIEMEIFGEDDQTLPHDGQAMGRLMVKGPAISNAYFRIGTSAVEPNGWFDTGDIATIDALGFMKITDRAKDVIKSGGEWISSQDVENAALLHPSVAFAAAIGIGHPRWGERPILFVQPKPGMAVDGEAIRQFLAGHLAKWCIPDTVHEIATMPLGPTGKVDKKQLRKLHHD
jgi:fatty-acyl-CoA synthase